MNAVIALQGGKKLIAKTARVRQPVMLGHQDKRCCADRKGRRNRPRACGVQARKICRIVTLDRQDMRRHGLTLRPVRKVSQSLTRLAALGKRVKEGAGLKRGCGGHGGPFCWRSPNTPAGNWQIGVGSLDLSPKVLWS